jgi:hypothetical protein
MKNLDHIPRINLNETPEWVQRKLIETAKRRPSMNKWVVFWLVDSTNKYTVRTVYKEDAMNCSCNDRQKAKS